MTGPTDDMDDDKDGAALAGEYALGLLDPAEVAVVEARLRVDPGFAALVDDWQMSLALMLEDTESVQPPPGVIRRLESTLFAEQTRPLWQRLNILPAILGAAAAAAILWLALTLNLLSPGDGQGLVPTHVATLASEDQTLVVTAAYSDEAGQLALIREAGGPAPGRALELWAGARRRAGGWTGGADLSWPAGRRSETALSLPPDLAALLPEAALAISDEPAGGSPTGAPTGAVLAAAHLTTG